MFKADLNYYKNVADTQISAIILKNELLDLIKDIKRERKNCFRWQKQKPKKPCKFVAKFIDENDCFFEIYFAKKDKNKIIFTNQLDQEIDFLEADGYLIIG